MYRGTARLFVKPLRRSVNTSQTLCSTTRLKCKQNVTPLHIWKNSALQLKNTLTRSTTTHCPPNHYYLLIHISFCAPYTVIRLVSNQFWMK